MTIKNNCCTFWLCSKNEGRSKRNILYDGPSREALATDPHLEIYIRKGLEVLYLYDPVDEFVISSVNKYKEFDLKSVDQVDLKTLDKFETTDDKKEKVKKIN